MGRYVNPSDTEFRRALDDDIYVDKSGLINYTNDRINKARRYLCVSRPRRFGKSMAADMLAAYYSKGCDSGTLFSELKVAQEEKKETVPEQEKEKARAAAFKASLNQHNVIRLDVQQFLFDESHIGIFIDMIQEAVIGELREEYGDCFEVDQYGLPGVLRQLFTHTGEGFVFIIDEWDCVFRIAKGSADVQKNYLDFLRGLFKGADYVELAYMTGILPIKKYGEHSAINIFREFSMLNPGRIAEYFGFMEDEVRCLCMQYAVDYAATRNWYDGYLVGDLHIYNPQAVTDLMDRGDFQSYWSGTETYEALKIYIEQNFDGLKEVIIMMLGGGHCRIDPTTFQNDMTTFKIKDDVLTLLVHLGYLTYDKKTSEVFIPNQEVAQEFIRAIKVGGWDGLIKALSRSEKLLQYTWALDGEAIAAGVAAIHDETVFNT